MAMRSTLLICMWLWLQGGNWASYCCGPGASADSLQLGLPSHCDFGPGKCWSHAVHISESLSGILVLQLCIASLCIIPDMVQSSSSTRLSGAVLGAWHPSCLCAAAAHRCLAPHSTATLSSFQLQKPPQACSSSVWMRLSSMEMWWQSRHVGGSPRASHFHLLVPAVSGRKNSPAQS